MKIRNLFPPVVCLAAMTAIAGCHMKNPFAAGKPAAVTKSVVAAAPQQSLPIDYSKYQPNELGEIPILEYHQLVPDSKKATGYQYNVTAFRNDMERLYSLNYRPVNLTEYVTGHIDCPAGKSPVVLTFDDALPGQIDYTPDGKIDPNCVVGILQQMHQEHSDWPLHGTFFILPRKGYRDYFFQPEYSQAKVQWLAANGFELGNHTIHHLQGIKHWPDERVEKEFADAAALIDETVPGYKVDLLALPYGVFPKNQKLVISGDADGTHYHNICALLAGAAPAPSPISKHFNPYRLQRIIPGNERFAIDYWLKYLEANKIKKYVSDGDPNTFTYPSLLSAGVDPARLKATHCLSRTY